VFLHDALVEAHLSGNTEVTRDEISDYVQKLSLEIIDDEKTSAKDLDEHQTLIEKQFKVS